MNNQAKKSINIFAISILSIAVIALGIVNIGNLRKMKSMERYLEASYFHSFDELVTSMGQIDTALQKSLLATSPGVTVPLCTEVFGRAMTAQMSLGALPCGTTELEQTAAFISRVGDYAMSLSGLSAQGGHDGEARENLRALSETAGILSQNLRGLQADIYDGRLTISELTHAQDNLEMSEGGDATVGGSMRAIEGEFPEIPSLIYDGPFSEHISEMKPKMLEGAEEFDVNQARKSAASFVGVPVGKVSPAGQSNGDLPCYYFNASVGEEEYTVGVTRKGGKPISMTSGILPPETLIKVEEAQEAARRFLEQRGYKNLTESYYMLRDNIATINFAHTQDGVICYPDLIKADVRMDTGAVIGFEALGYISSHHQREFPAIEVDAETARARVPEEFEVLSEALALIPTEGKHEVLCHEFKCSDADENHFIIYVSVVTGEQQKILILLEDETGTLTL